MRSRIGLGDLVRAWDALGRDGAYVPVLLSVLGLELAAEAVAAGPLVDNGSPPVEGMPDAPSRTPPVEAAGSRASDTASSDRGDTAALRPAELRPLPRRPPPTPAWVTAGRLADPVPSAPAAPPEPLFEPRRERALVAAAARTLRAEGALDVPALVAAVAALRPIAGLPRRRILSLRGGLQLLVDRTPWMAPYAADVEAIRRRIAGIVGAAVQVTVVRADRHGGIGLPATWEPRAGMPVLAVTDLGRAAGRAGRTTPRELWAEVARRSRGAGAELTVIVPGSRAAHEAVIPPGVVVVPWDRATAVGRVARDARGSRR